jgi:hypothetical protein
MSNVQIPNLTSATSLSGSEQLEAVQSGSSVKVTTAQIGQYVATTYPAPGISSVTANSPLQSSTVSGAVTITLPTAAISNTYLAQMASGTVKANLTGGSASPSDVTPSAILDTFGSTVGSLLYRGSSNWQELAPSTNGYVLATQGSGNAPHWINLGLGSMAYENSNNVSITGGSLYNVDIETSTINQTTIGATTPSTGAFTNLSFTGTGSFGTISSGTWNGSTIGVSYGGTGANNATGARTNLGAAASGANSDITSLSGLTTPLSATQGGTGFNLYTTGDLLYASSSTNLARLNDVATGNVLLSGGVGVAPSWGKVGLTTAVSGTLPVANGGTGATSLSGYLFGNGTGAVTAQTTIPNSGLTNSAVTIGSTSISLGGTSTTLAGLTTVTVTQDPTAALQLSTKQYVDNQISTVSNTTFHTAAQAATTANLNATYSNGVGGVGATLTNAGTQAAFVVDGYTASLNDRILVKDMTTAAYNGIYTVTTLGSGSTNWVLTRATDFNTVGSGPNYIETGAAVFIQGGTVWGSTSWVMTTTGSITVGTTSLNWTQTSSSGNITVSAPITKTGNTIGLSTVTVPYGGTGQTTLQQYSVLLGNGTGNVAYAAPNTTGYALLSTGASSNPAFGQLSLTAGVTGTLPVGNGGTGTATAFTSGSVVFAGASGVYTQDNAKFFWDNTNYRLGLNTATPQTTLTIVSNTQTTTPTGTLPSGTDLYIVGANSANTRITQDAYGTGNYPVYTGRSARGTAASPTATQSGDFLAQFSGRGYGATGFASNSTGYFAVSAAENFTDTAQGAYASVFTTATGSTTATEAFRFGSAGQLGIGGATYGTSGYVLTSGGASAAPTWSQVSLTTGVTGTLPVGNGGTGLTSYTIGDLIYASGTTTLSKLADVATGNVLLSGGVGVAPAWGQVSLTSAVTGVLPIANGGTNSNATPTAGGVGYGTGTAHAYTAAGTSGQVLTSGGSSTPTWTSLSGVAVTSLVAGTNISISGSTGSVTVNTINNPSFSTSVTTPIVNGSSTLSLQTGGTTGLYIDGSQNVGIGTTSPSSYGKLAIVAPASVYGLGISAASTGGVYYHSAFYNGSTQISYFNSDGTNFGLNTVGSSAAMFFSTNSSERMRIDSSGNVGIGTTSPSTLLHVSNASAVIRIGLTASSQYTDIYRDGATGFTIYNAAQASPYRSHVWQLGGTEAMRIDSSGNVGIGTNSPSNYGNSYIRNITAFLGDQNITLGAYYQSGVGQYGFINSGNTNNGNAQPLVFQGGGVERMRIDSSGNLLVGTTTVGGYSGAGTQVLSTKLYIGTNTTSTGALGSSTKMAVVTDSDNPQYVLVTTNASSGNKTWRMIARNSGNFQIQQLSDDTTSETNRLTIDTSGNVSIANYLTAPGVFCNSGSSYFINSDTAGNAVRILPSSGGTQGIIQWTNYAINAQWTSLVGTNNLLTCTTAFAKASGSFKIQHPLPSMNETHNLVHSFIEGPQADLIYRGTVLLVNGHATINIDTSAKMTEGTFVLLCRDVQCFTTNETDWTPVKGSVAGNILTIQAQDQTSTATISWMVIGERQDKHMYETPWTDKDGKVIVEPLREIMPTPTFPSEAK